MVDSVQVADILAPVQPSERKANQKLNNSTPLQLEAWDPAARSALNAVSPGSCVHTAQDCTLSTSCYTVPKGTLDVHTSDSVPHLPTSQHGPTLTENQRADYQGRQVQAAAYAYAQ